MSENQNLKYIHMVYKNTNGEYHVERFKVVYRIKDTIFYHKPASNSLDSVNYRRIKERLDVSDLCNMHCVSYCLERPDDEMLKRLRTEVRKKDLENAISFLQSRETTLLVQLDDVRTKIKNASEELLKYKEG